MHTEHIPDKYTPGNLNSVPMAVVSCQAAKTMPDVENCRNGLLPANTADEIGTKRKITVPCVLTMTKYLFDHYRLCMYSYLNRSLRRGLLHRITGIPFTDQVINKQVCRFNSVSYWRIDPLNFWADVSITPHLNTAEGYYDWQGMLSLWFTAEDSNVLSGTIEEISAQDEPPERDGTKAEIDTLALSSFVLTAELATRFLGDYILGSPYFKINYPEHNLVRTRCQIALAKDMLKRLPEMEKVVAECMAKNA